ncbi:hypothetical protein QE152_g34906 [Popillia japonica]|uniref:Uncharacterized protein n=1 Tax=Popillia japonica TaxID=7064 RepID=A0AAW1ISS0_POPJA
MEALLIAKQYFAIAEKSLNKKKKDHFRNFCATLNRHTNLSRVWWSRVVLSHVPLETEIPPHPVGYIDHSAKLFSYEELRTVITDYEDSSPSSDLISFAVKF